jgi:hypothetical protein
MFTVLKTPVTLPEEKNSNWNHATIVKREIYENV